MKHILAALYLGNLEPMESVAPLGAPYRRKVEEAIKLETLLLSTLDVEGKAVFEQYQRVQSSLCALLDAQAFVAGFRMGAQTMHEIMEDTPTDEEE